MGMLSLKEAVATQLQPIVDELVLWKLFTFQEKLDLHEKYLDFQSNWKKKICLGQPTHKCELNSALGPLVCTSAMVLLKVSRSQIQELFVIFYNEVYPHSNWE